MSRGGYLKLDNYKMSSVRKEGHRVNKNTKQNRIAKECVAKAKRCQSLTSHIPGKSGIKNRQTVEAKSGLRHWALQHLFVGYNCHKKFHRPNSTIAGDQ